MHFLSVSCWSCCVCLSVCPVQSKETPDSERQNRLPLWTDRCRANIAPRMHFTNTRTYHTHTKTHLTTQLKAKRPRSRWRLKSRPNLPAWHLKSGDAKARNSPLPSWCLFKPNALLHYSIFSPTLACFFKPAWCLFRVILFRSQQKKCVISTVSYDFSKRLKIT